MQADRFAEIFVGYRAAGAEVLAQIRFRRHAGYRERQALLRDEPATDQDVGQFATVVRKIIKLALPF